MLTQHSDAAVTNGSRNGEYSLYQSCRRTFRASTSPSAAASSTEGGADRSLAASRAAAAVELLPTYLADARAVEKYSPSTPNGALQLSVAENQMLEDMLVPSLTEFSRTQEFLADAIYYQPTHGRESFRKAMAAYLKDLLSLSNDLDVDGIVVGAGCNAVLENLCLCLAEQGEGVMIPTPYYAAFEFDLVARAGENPIEVNVVSCFFVVVYLMDMEIHCKGLSILPVETMNYQNIDSLSETSTIAESAYYPTKAALDATFSQAIENGTKPRILLLSHPQNPLGICYPPEVVQECIDWCRENKVHLVSDEIYAGSVYRPAEANFVSALELASSHETVDDSGLGLGPYVHLVYALSKDFALSGLRVGALYSENQAIRLRK